MANISNLTSYLKDVADAIREKTNTTDEIPASEFDVKIKSIETGIDTSDATATENDIVEGKTAYVDGKKIEGNISALEDNTRWGRGSIEIKIQDIEDIPFLTMSGNNDQSDAGAGWVDPNKDKRSVITNSTNLMMYVGQFDAADAIGLTSEKIVVGNTILGVEGTAEISGGGQGGNALINSNAGTAIAGLEEITIDASERTSLNSFFNGCSSLTKINMSGADTGKITNMWRAFYGCYLLETLPTINMQNVTSVDSCFYNCRKIKKIPFLNTTKATMLYYTFYNCNSLEELPEIDGSLFDKIRESFIGMTALTTFGGIKNLGKNYSSSANNSYCTLSLSSSTQLTKESLLNVINGLYDLASAEKSTQSLVLGDTNLAKLTAEEIEIATNKGWTVS